MDYFPIFVAVKAQKILFVGGGMDIVHKVRLALKTTAEIHLFSHDLVDGLVAWRDTASHILPDYQSRLQAKI